MKSRSGRSNLAVEALPIPPATCAIEMLQHLMDAVVDPVAMEMSPDRHRIVQHRMSARLAWQTKRGQAEYTVRDRAQLPTEMILVDHIISRRQIRVGKHSKGARTAAASSSTSEPVAKLKST